MNGSNTPTYSILESPIGELLAIERDGALTDLHVLAGRHVPTRAADWRAERTPLMAAVARQLAEYFAGERRVFDLPLAPLGTAFQRAAWRALLAIPYGQTRSYAEQARALGRPTATRAVGAANSRNPIAILIPCHRVIAADGGLGGYAGGLPVKRALLAIEAGREAGNSLSTP
ncbi:MAG: methylated-DNA--[protein]-cysteine S-methyltransferase [Casimicrobiaceae bacterium]